ncbi:hypothetical protein [Dialister invisus]|uniref:hypothetical protein n=1 Tax=Dialister invisus TaxID=218538 RepID=UPI0026596861|nr:hypothetical protein [Dialister invisus]
MIQLLGGEIPGIKNTRARVFKGVCFLEAMLFISFATIGYPKSEVGRVDFSEKQIQEGNRIILF